MTAETFIERCSSLDQSGWLDLRLALWPGGCSTPSATGRVVYFVKPL